MSQYSIGFFSQLEEKGKLEILNWCKEFGLVTSSYVCPSCGRNMGLLVRKGCNEGYAWRCKRRGPNSHDVTRSVRLGTWFSKSHLSICEILLITRYWFGRCSNDFVMSELGVHSHTVVDWFMLCREVCTFDVFENSVKIGGPGIIVEVDESKFGKMKFQLGRQMHGKWVFGGIERGSNKCFFTTVSNRSNEELLRVIKTWILPGSVVISECWRAYDCLSDKEFLDLTTEHKLTFRDSEMGAHTYSFDGSWAAVKRFVKSGSNHVKGEFDSYLGEYLWRKMHNHSLSDNVFEAFLKAIIKFYPPQIKD